MFKTTRSSAAIILAAGLFAAGSAPGSEPAATKRLPVPAADAVSKARELIRDAYESDYAAAKKSGEYAGLLEKLRGFARTEADPVKKYAFLLEAEEVAADRDDAAATLETVDRRAAWFEIDGLDERAKTLARLATPRVAPDLALYNQALDTATKAAAAERFDIAATSAKLAIEVAKAIKRFEVGPRQRPPRRPAAGEAVPPANGAELVRKAVDLQSQLTKQKKLFDEYQGAKAVLDGQPEDPVANAKAGSYLCLVARKWDQGLPHLKTAGTGALADLAAAELALGDPASADAAAVFALAGRWWNAAGESTRLVEGGGDAAKDHAAALYAGLIARLTDNEEKQVAVNRAGSHALKPTKPDTAVDGERSDPVPVVREAWNITLPPDAVVWERNGNAYKVFTGDLNAPADGAKERCASMGGHLVFINSAEEQAFVRELLKAAGDGQRFLAGASNTRGDRKWRWDDSSLLSFAAWAPDQPSKDNTEQLFLHLDMAAEGAWRGGPAASDHIGFVCEWERPATGQNVAVNSSFEAGAEPYWLRGEGTMVVKDKKVRTGEAACVLSSDGYAGIYQDVPVTWGDKITISFWAEPHLPLGHSAAEVHMGPDMWKEGIGGSIRPERVENGWHQYTATMHIPPREAAPTLGPKTKVGIAIFMRGCKPVHVDDFEIIVERGAGQALAGKLPARGQTFKSYRLVAQKSNANGWEAYYRTIELYDADGKKLTGGNATGTGQGAADAFDDDRETKYRTVMSPGVEEDWIAYEMPLAVALSRIKVVQYGQDCNHVFEFEVQGSNDGRTWTPIMRAKNVLSAYDSADPSCLVEWISR